MKILEIKNLNKHFDGVAAVDNLSLSFEAGKITGIIGPNGSGKTTLTNLLSAVLPYDSGEIVIAGKSLNKAPAYYIAAHGLSRTFQEVRLFNQMTVVDNLLLALTERPVFKALFDTHSKEEMEEAEKILKKLGIFDKRDKLAGQLSYGQRKLLEIGRVLAVNPKIVLFDEPFAGLFPEMIKIVVSIMQELKEHGTTLVLIEHNMELIRQLVDHLFVMDSGKLLAEGSAEEVLKKPEVIEAYLGE